VDKLFDFSKDVNSVYYWPVQMTSKGSLLPEIARYNNAQTEQYCKTVRVVSSP